MKSKVKFGIGSVLSGAMVLAGIICFSRYTDGRMLLGFIGIFLGIAIFTYLVFKD